MQEYQKHKNICPLVFSVMVIAFLLGVTNAWLNLVKVSVKTRMFSLLFFEGSTLVKSTHNRSIELLAIIIPSFVFGSV